MSLTRTAGRGATEAPALTLVDVPYRRKLFLVAALTSTLFVATMNQTVVATAAQNIVADIGGFGSFVWLFAGFSLAASVGVPIVGKLSDVLGRKRVLIGSLAFFLIASAVAGSAATMTQLIVFRVFQGAGFAGVMGSIWIIMAAMWAPRDRAKWMGVATAGFTLSGVMGPVFGGVISDALSWRWVFFINIPTGGISLVLLWAWFPALERERRPGRLDLAGAFWFAVSATTLLLALTWGGRQYAWDSLPVVGSVAVSVVALAVFARTEIRAEDPMLPLGLFRRRVFSLAWLASLSVTTSFIALAAFQPLFVQGVLGKTATAASGPLVAMAVGVAAGANVSGQLLSRRGHPRELGMFGMLVAASGLFAMGRIDAGADIWTLYVVAAITGFGISFGFTSMTVPVQNAMPLSLLGVVTSTLQFARMFGQAAGSAVFGAVLLAVVSTGVVAGMSGDEAVGPESRITDPEVIVSVDELETVRAAYIDDGALGIDRFDADLARSRENLAGGLSAVFTLASVFAGFGVLLVYLGFTGESERPDDDGEETLRRA